MKKFLLFAALTFALMLHFSPDLAILLFVFALAVPAIPGGSLRAITISDLMGPTGGEDNIGGTQGFIYWAPVRDFETINEPKSYTDASDFAELVVIATAHVFKTGGKFYSLYCTVDRGNVKNDRQGEPDGYSFNPNATIFYPGTLPEALGLARFVKSLQTIVLVPLSDGVIHQIGTSKFPARWQPQFDTGTNASGVRGHEFLISSMVASGGQIYDAPIQLEEQPEPEPEP